MEEEKKLEGEIIVKRPSLMRRIFKLMAYNGREKSMIDHVTDDIIRPGLINLLYDAGNGILKQVLYGDSNYRANNSSSNRTNYVMFGSKKSSSTPYSRPEVPSQQPLRYAGYELQDICFKSRVDGMIVLDQINDIMQNEHKLRVAELYEIMDMPAPFTTNNYGWTDISQASLQQHRDGWRLDMPPVERLNS